MIPYPRQLDLLKADMKYYIIMGILFLGCFLKCSLHDNHIGLCKRATFLGTHVGNPFNYVD